MAKLYPPSLEGAIPALLKDENGIEITIPFSHNRAISPASIGGFSLRIKTTQSTSYLGTLKQEDYIYNENNNFVKFYIDRDTELYKKLRQGQFYKFQLAYLNKKLEEGNYSSVSVGKVTTKPNMKILELNLNEINNHIFEYTGQYSQENGDTGEKVYSYRFDVYNDKNEWVAGSGDQLHNSENDTESYQSQDTFRFNKEIEDNTSYSIVYSVKTINGLEISSPRYKIMQMTSIDPQIGANLIAELNEENGYIKLYLKPIETNYVSGNFVLSRQEVGTGYWEELNTFSLNARIPDFELWKDMTVEHGKNYIYSLQQYNRIYSNRLLSNTVAVKFEHSFLFDGIKQLKIKYNPKVSSFKANIPEAKIETIGGKHPVIFRNGKVNYKEFPISGLISYYSDEENLFTDDSLHDYSNLQRGDDLTLFSERTTNLTDENIYNERKFKTQVQKWLSNGEAKLFRSPVEGNFIVRLLNVSLSPMDQLGRMLHTFNCTAYEVADFSYKNIRKYALLDKIEYADGSIRWCTVSLKDQETDLVAMYNRSAQIIKFYDVVPGTQFELSFADGTSMSLMIGATGSYEAEFDNYVIGIKLVEETKAGYITYGYIKREPSVFDYILDMTIEEIPARQIAGKADIFATIEGNYKLDGIDEPFKNPKIKLGKFLYIKAFKREQIKVAKDDKIVAQNVLQLSQNKNQDNIISVDAPSLGYDANPYVIYDKGQWEKVEKAQDDKYVGYRPGYVGAVWVSEGYNDGIDTTLTFTYKDGTKSIIDLNDTEYLYFEKPYDVIGLQCGEGVLIECGYQVCNITYTLEAENDTIEELIEKLYNEAAREGISYDRLVIQ